MHLQPGTILHHRYHIEKSIGQGGFGISYLANDVNLDTKVCIKELFISGICTRSADQTVQSQNLKDLSFEDFIARFLKEAKELARFNHPNIVKVTDIFQQNGTAYFVMEYIDGVSLKEMVMKSGRLAMDKAIPMVLQIFSAIETVHKAGMLHRDIKPDNIMLSKNDQITIIDFGSARNYEEGRTLTQTAILTPGYAPLEQYSERGKRGPFTDIYALGATIYFLLTGTKPLAATDRHHEELKAPHLLNPEISVQISSAIMLAMSLRAEERFQTVAEFQGAIQNKVNPVKTNGKPLHSPARNTQTPKTEQKGRYGLILIVLGIILVAGAIQVFRWYGSKNSNHSETDHRRSCIQAIQLYYSLLEKGEEAFKTDELFSDYQDTFISMRNTNPSEIQTHLSKYFWHQYVNRRYELDTSNFRMSITKNMNASNESDDENIETYQLSFVADEYYLIVSRNVNARPVRANNFVILDKNFKIKRWVYRGVISNNEIPNE